METMQRTLKKEAQQQGIGDKINSSFWWRIQLDPKHPEYTSKYSSVMIHGYSKWSGYAERHDQYQVLQNNLCFLLKKYQHKSEWITLHKRTGPICDINGGGDPAIIIFKPGQKPFLTRHLVLSSFQLSNHFQEYVTTVYAAYLRGEDIDLLKPGYRVKQSAEDWLDPLQHHFRGLEQLNNYLIRLHNKGFSEEQIKHFYDKYRGRFPSLK